MDQKRSDEWLLMLPQNGHPDRSAAQWRDLLFFRPSDMAHPNKSHHPPLCHPERTRISYFAAPPAATYAALRQESRMKSTETTLFDRKSGAAEGPAAAPAGNSICLSLGIRSAVRPG